MSAIAIESGAYVARGNIYLSRELCDWYLGDASAVALLRRERDVLVVPLVRDSAGGMLLMLRNARGDRVVHAQDFFRGNGLIEDAVRHPVAVRWSEESAALVLIDVPEPNR